MKASMSKSSFGPGILVTAAFIGPGTITTASIAGAEYGFALMWALLFSVLATIVLQEMTARLGLVTRQGLAEALRLTYSGSWLGNCAILLVVCAIGFGNAAYEAGNITGAALGLESISGIPVTQWSLAVGLLAAVLLASGRYSLIEKLLVVLVLLMSLVFLTTLIMVGPSPGAMLQGLFVPRLPEGSLLTVIALIGTTVVPYNLFLHASAVQEKWPAQADPTQALKQSRVDTGLSIGLGGDNHTRCHEHSCGCLLRHQCQLFRHQHGTTIGTITGCQRALLLRRRVVCRWTQQRGDSSAGGCLCGLWRPGLAPGHAWYRLSIDLVGGIGVRNRICGAGNQTPDCNSLRPGCQWVSVTYPGNIPVAGYEPQQAPRSLRKQPLGQRRWRPRGIGNAGVGRPENIAGAGG